MVKNIVLLSLTLLLFTSNIFAQTERPHDLDKVFSTAREQVLEYIKAFRNLAATEKKTFQILKPDGAIKKSRSVESNFIVYQLSKKNEQIVEYRHVLAVDGKRLDKADSRAEDFFEKLVKVENSAKELERIRNESLRYDDELQIDGYTLFQGVVFSRELADAVDFDLAAIETVDGSETYVLKYQQVNPSKYIFLAGKGNPAPDEALISIDLDEKPIEEMNLRLRGTLWLDKQTFQIRRENRELTIQPAGYDKPLLVSQTKFNYQDSDFGILTPKRIESVIYGFDRKKRASIAEVKAVFEYSSFSRPDVEVESGDVKQN